jgi:hypothetical protein
MLTLRINAFRGCVTSFIVALAEHGIPYHPEEPLYDGPDAASMALEVPLGGSGEDALATALVTWLEARGSRRANIITKDSAVVWLEGYSAEDVTEFLDMATHMAVMEITPPYTLH